MIAGHHTIPAIDDAVAQPGGTAAGQPEPGRRAEQAVCDVGWSEWLELTTAPTFSWMSGSHNRSTANNSACHTAQYSHHDAAKRSGRVVVQSSATVGRRIVEAQAVGAGIISSRQNGARTDRLTTNACWVETALAQCGGVGEPMVEVTIG